MPLDPHVAQLIDGLSAQGFTSFEHLTVDQAREVIATFTGLQAPPRDIARIENLTYRSGEFELPLRLYIPDGDAPRPVVLYLHGGGFVGGTIDVADEPCRAVADRTGALVVSADYRLAPEHKFPAAPDDAYAALEWVAAHIGEYGGDPENIVIMGDSAGGNLAAVTALRARDDNHGPVLRGQILLYPVIDPKADFPSKRDYADGYVITAPALDWFWDHYLTSPDDTDHPYAVPLRAADLGGLPPALVLTNEYEAGRDEAEHYGRALSDAGVDTTVRRFDGLVHGVFWMSGAVPRSAEMLDAVCEHVRALTATASA